MSHTNQAFLFYYRERSVLEVTMMVSYCQVVLREGNKRVSIILASFEMEIREKEREITELFKELMIFLLSIQSDQILSN